VVGLVLGNLGVGLSFGWWVDDRPASAPLGCSVLEHR
jgi:hypothetical protein